MCSSVFAATGSSPEFKLDLRGLGPWQRHTAAAAEALTYSSTWATNAASGAKAVVKVMPVLKTKPKYLVIDLSGGTNATSYGISYLDEVPGGTWSDEYKTSKLVLRHIPAGSFIMGGRATDYPGAVNTNLHMVTITRDFYMGVFEVTQRQWELVMGNRPSIFINSSCYATRPVECVRWVDVRGSVAGIQWPMSKQVDETSFMGVLQRKANMGGLDLATEAQWEYACRAGKATSLNSGKDLSNKTNAVEMMEVGRYAWNSGLNDCTTDRFPWITNHNNSAANMATAAVGSYQPNALGLYDMHGNVAEWCLDRFLGTAIGSLNPVGGDYAGGVNAVRIYRGGSWWHAADGCIAGQRSAGDTVQDGSSVGYRNYQNWGGYLGWPSVGFRLCLQGGDIPDFASASTLVNESGAGSQSWSPTRSGAYYLTHSTMNGTTNVQLASAWFEVAGCTLTLEPQGELTNGVNVAIGGAGEVWTVYYTTDGSTPTQASARYEGPFSLPESATVRAVAYNEQGVASEETSATFTLHDALSVVGAVARQRYPWNGMVDVDVELKGDPEAKYQVEIEAKDLDGGTNLSVRTVGARVPACPHANADANGLCWKCGHAGRVTLPPGTHRLTWNADADIAADGEFPRVAVTVKATRQSVVAAYNRSLSIAVDGYTGAETLTNVPVLVRLSTNITGFAYSDFASPTNGADLAFFDADENKLPYEIDEWHTNGESLVWVKLPTMVKGTTFTCAYGGSSSMNGRAQDATSAKHEVWAEYAGVWHMNEDSGTAYDSTEHAMDALPNVGTNALADTSQMVAYENGACGRGRVNGNSNGNGLNNMLVPTAPYFRMGERFVVDGWFRANGMATGDDPRLISKKSALSAPWSKETGFDVNYENSLTNLLVRGQTNSYFLAATPSIEQQWVKVTVVYEGSSASVYANGHISKTGSIGPVLDNDDPVTFGGGDVKFSLNGQYDEIRLRGGSLSADRIKADYDMIANRKFCTYGAVKMGAE